MRKLFLSAAALALALMAGTAAQAQVKHIGDPRSFISSAVSIPAGSDILFVSGITPSPTTPGGTDYGDTKAQAITILDKIGAILKDAGYGFGDVAMMRVYLVADPNKGGKMDFAGLNEAFKMYFGTAEQPAKPARIAMQITQLASPAFLVEIECQAAKTPMKPMPMKK
jgi:enamine deaminase RidA (YjgF/YER057c/UK114 family)